MIKKYTLLVLFYVSYVIELASINISPTANWIKPLPLPIKQSIQANDINNGYYYILQDEQINIETKQYYYHYAYKITSEAGVQNASELSLYYNPAYEKFALHHIRVFRDGKYIDKTKSSGLKEIQRESGFEEHLYNETMSVIAVLKDIKPGDVVEYDYTTTGENPIFEGKFYYNYYFSYNYELLHGSLRLLKPLNRKINAKIHNTTLKPNTTIYNNNEEIIYEVKNQKGFEIDKSIPNSYFPYYSIELSEYNDWQKINEWSTKIFSFQEKNSEKLTAKINGIKKLSTNKNEQIISALRFVQNEIRYMGFEIGVNSHKPAAPNKVIDQGYGDCKDKSTLLCKILNEIGIKAYPALVNSSSIDDPNYNLISPRIFNHCIVKVEIDDKTHWFDPTISYQGGNIDNYFTPNYKFALVIGGTANQLEKMPENSRARVEVKDDFKIKDFSGNAEFTTKTIYYGTEADNMRNSFANTGIKDMQENFIDFYKKFFPEISSAKDIKIEDDKINNTITLYEYYSIKKFWLYPDSANKTYKESSVYAYMINEKINSYSATLADRTMPLYLEFPLHIIEKIHMEMPDDWEIENETIDKSNAFIKFIFKKIQSKNIIDLEFEYKTLSDQIPANKAKDFITNIDEITENSIGLTVTYNDNGKPNNENEFSLNWLMVFIFLMSIGIFIYWAINNYRKQQANIHAEVDEFGHAITPTPIGGWLVLPMIGLLVFPFIILVRLLRDNSYFNLIKWNKVTIPNGIGYHQLFAPLLIFELLSFALLLVFSILLCFMLFTYKKKFPKYIIAFYLFNLFVIIITTVCANYILTQLEISPDYDFKEIGRSVFQCAIWIPYFLISERVRETFIR
jgi:hypothetical protein